MVAEFINTYGVTILYAVLTGVFGWIGIQLKRLAEKYINTKEKQAVCKTVVAAVNQIYYDLDGPEKLQKAIESASEMLAAKGITVTELELRMLLEAAVNAAKRKKTEQIENNKILVSESEDGEYADV